MTTTTLGLQELSSENYRSRELVYNVQINRTGFSGIKKKTNRFLLLVFELFAIYLAANSSYFLLRATRAQERTNATNEAR